MSKVLYRPAASRLGPGAHESNSHLGPPDISGRAPTAPKIPVRGSPSKPSSAKLTAGARVAALQRRLGPIVGRI